MFEKRSDYEANILSDIFQLSNRLQVYLDKKFIEDDITAKQFIMLSVVDSFKNEHPTFTDIGEKLGSSRQNVKQLALKLEHNDFIRITLDTSDSRSKRVSLTVKGRSYWENDDIFDKSFVTSLFSKVSTTQLKNIHHSMVSITEELPTNNK